jgi:cell division protein FtsW
MQRLGVLLLMVAVGFLVAMGLVMLASTGEYAPDAHGKSYFFLKHQLMWFGVGVCGCVCFARTNYQKLVKNWGWIYLAAVILLFCCFIPGIGAKINGSRRWIRLMAFTFQPSELGKMAAVFAMAWWFSQEKGIEKEWIRGFFAPLGIIGVLMGLTICEVDVGSTVLIGGTAVSMLFIAGAPWRFVGTIALSGVLAVCAAIRFMPERLGRFMAFLDPERFPDDAYQTQQGLIALGSGGLGGLGLGNGRQKLLYLPYAHTDFIFPVVGEELGLLGTLSVVLAYVLMILGGMMIAARARDRAGLFVGMGIVTLIAMQAAINLGVTTQMLPNKGLPLPFISYGGSNLAFCLLGIGVLINIYRQGVSEQEERHFQQVELALKLERQVVRL